jgi:hypothetical protein
VTGSTTPPGFSYRYAIRLPDGGLAMGPYDSPWMWERHDSAVKALGYFAEAARKIGAENWRGEVVHQLCTPWIGEHDNAARLVDELSAWLAEQTGSQE